MKLVSQGIAVVLSVKEETMQNGGKYWKMAVAQEGEAGSISCTEEVFKIPIEQYKEYVLDFIFDDKYGRMKCINLRPYSRK